MKQEGIAVAESIPQIPILTQIEEFSFIESK